MGWFHSEEAKLKRSIFMKELHKEGRYKDIYTKESKEKMRLSHLGKKQSEETKMKMRLSHKGKKKSEEHKRNLSFAIKGIIRSQETKNKIKEWRADKIYPKQDTSIEVKVQSLPSALHIEYIAHKYISEIEHKYCCDIFIPSTKIVIECDGDYFHGNPSKFNADKLNEKQIQQKQRDEIRTKELIEKGYRVIRLWEHEIKKMDSTELKVRIEGGT